MFRQQLLLFWRIPARISFKSVMHRMQKTNFIRFIWRRMPLAASGACPLTLKQVISNQVIEVTIFPLMAFFISQVNVTQNYG